VKAQDGTVSRRETLGTFIACFLFFMYNSNQNELDILEFWDKDQTFQKSIDQRPDNKPYVFYDGPPFATGLPHYGHIVASTMKDVIPRYKTMQGYRVNRVWGWDCHGLPIENIVEKELGTKSKKEIEEMGVAKFNELCESKVLGYVDDWKKVIRRLGRWVDMDNAYKTMDLSYMESVWWVFKQLWDKGLVYQGYRAMHICPRCETTLSQQEVSEGYKDVKDISVVAKFKVTNKEATKLQSYEGDVFVLAWTTTPWTLPGNVLLAVGAEIEYSVVVFEGAHYVVAKELVLQVFADKEFQVVDSCVGADLVGLTYEPLFPYYGHVEGIENAYRVVTADFVTTTDGTGVVHIAPAFGTDDYEVFKKEKVPFIQHVGMDGRFKKEVLDFAGTHVKPIGDHTATDVEIIKYLAHNGKLFSKLKYEHSYPHCWRCDTPLLNYATSSWFVSVEKVKERALQLAQDINWSPEHIKEGRFGQWLAGARDWSISRQRFWATTIPVWQSEDGDTICYGSVAELEADSGVTVTNLHKHKVDEIVVEKNGKTYKRVPDVLDTWFDSGSMPYAERHYPFEKKGEFEGSFPAEFIAEGQDQTRAWFYYLHVLATAVMDKPAFKNVIVNGIVLAEDGKKMSKKLQNYPDPMKLIESYGSDALRYYLMASPVVAAENLNFVEAGVREVFSKLVNTLWNVLEMYKQASGSSDQRSGNTTMSEHVLDRWIVAKLHVLIREVTEGLEKYELHTASRPLADFVLGDLSQWYVRRSRDRFESGEGVETLRYVLETLSKLLAPFTPFIAETVFQETRNKTQETKQSVHLEMWPACDESLIEGDLIRDMMIIRNYTELTLSLRAETKNKIRQPLSEVFIAETLGEKSSQYFIDFLREGKSYKNSLIEIFLEETNIKSFLTEKPDNLNNNYVFKESGIYTVALNVEITEELKREGLAREVVRAINQLRKEKGLQASDKIVITWSTQSETLRSVLVEFASGIASDTSATEVREGSGEVAVEIEGESVGFSFEV
jgi:isoleucyl-tRNA synthetase